MSKSTKRFAQVPQRSGAPWAHMAATRLLPSCECLFGIATHSRGLPWAPGPKMVILLVFLAKNGREASQRLRGSRLSILCEDIAANGCLRCRLSPNSIFSGTFPDPDFAPGSPRKLPEAPGSPWQPPAGPRGLPKAPGGISKKSGFWVPGGISGPGALRAQHWRQ